MYRVVRRLKGTTGWEIYLGWINHMGTAKRIIEIGMKYCPDRFDWKIEDEDRPISF